MCHQVVISRHACRGYLHKLSSRIRSWQKRWFVFDRNKNKRTFMYYSDKSESKARGGVYFQVTQCSREPDVHTSKRIRHRHFT